LESIPRLPWSRVRDFRHVTRKEVAFCREHVCDRSFVPTASSMFESLAGHRDLCAACSELTLLSVFNVFDLVC
jgi:hypothetical protein